jgi:hypothetical protein
MTNNNANLKKRALARAAYIYKKLNAGVTNTATLNRYAKEIRQIEAMLKLNAAISRGAVNTRRRGASTRR